ncbi:hypothetical protein INT47_008763 [Mucor saturninus]|uniref:Zinc finger PHD-type domain-containing protein n=1 Tax=Mucor saturninus TaxID=64648 RepID=A0A8H7RL55_9FUNG|nr:hypothetical protein INT47_008763 [Mucor saturninus]
MTVHRRGGRPSTSVSKRKRPQQRRRSASTSDENSSDSGSITRYNLGLMVQCDKCEVWQHCRCMGLEQPDIPDQYYCEQCKPENHKTTRLSNGRLKRYYNALGATVAPKKRMTLNSREASMSLEDVLAARSALEMYEHHEPSHSPPPIIPEEEEEQEEKVIVEEERPAPPSSNVSSVGHDELPCTDTDLIVPITRKKVYKKRQKANESIQGTVVEKESGEKKRTYNRTAKPKKTHKARSRTGTPQPAEHATSLPPPSDEEVTPNGDTIATMLFEYFSPKSRASSPPAKCRQPSSRMSILEMNRRASQILEYISSIQVEMATLHAGHAKEEEEDDDNDSLSSASTLPLEETKHENQTSMEIMDILTRKLIQFQRRFGSRNRALYEEAMIEGEGRITRSREASGNANTYRNMIAH